MIYNLLILFLLFFCFPISGPLNSAYIAIVMALVKLIVEKKTYLFFRLLRNSYVKTLIYGTTLMTILAALWTIWLGANDFSLTAAFFSVIVGIVSVVLVVSSLNIKTINNDDFEKLCVNVFVIQAIISIIAFVLPSFREIVHHFQFANEAEKAEEAYSGFRGLAISGRLYFEFAVTCGLVEFVQFKRIIRTKKNSLIEYVKLFLLIICGFFAGRTSLIGVGFGFIFLVFSHEKLVDKIHFLLKSITISLVSVFFITILLPNTVLFFIKETLLPWVFDIFIKYHETGGTESSTSFNSLNDMYRTVSITTQEWFIGSGNYNDPHGSGYYKSVDAGYIRHILYWGILGSIINIWYGLLYFIRPLKHCFKWNDILYVSLICVYTFFVHYKGDIATTSRFYHVIIIFLFIPYITNKLTFKHVYRI